jgi:hypothetical protein
LQAYVYNRGEQLRREQQEELDRNRRRQEQYLIQNGVDPSKIHLPVKRVRIEDEFAVFVGGYPDMESASKELANIKKLPPPKSVPQDKILQATFDTTGTGAMPKEEWKAVNTFSKSMVLPNPTVPVSREDANKPDPFWKELNSGESYSLLKCSKPWTLAVKEFHGGVVIQSQTESTSFMDKLFGGKKSGEALNASAVNAHNLAEVLHKMGFDSYVLHTRTSSIVTIGAFDRPDDSKMETLRQVLHKERMRFASNDPRFPQGMDLFAQPPPMPVPRFN